VSLKVLGDDGTGYLSDVIEAIDWSVANRAKYGLKVINLSLGTAPQQSWRTDPVCHAIERAFTAGITVVAAAGNRGRTAEGDPVFGTIDSPGHCPHAITVGALNTRGTPWRSDDVMASYSSKGPTRDGLVKPDLVAPGHKVRGLLAPKSGIAEAHPEFVIGSGNGGLLELSGTSMSAAVTSGAAALLAVGDATPLEVRIRLQYSAERTTAALVIEGAGRLNVLGALAQNDSHSTVIASEAIPASQLVFAHGVVLGSYDDNITWSNGDNVVWSNYDDNIIWSNGANVVWSNYDDNIIWSNGDNVVWSNYDDNIVWSNFEHSVHLE
jgi:serine protease AprX